MRGTCSRGRKILFMTSCTVRGCELDTELHLGWFISNARGKRDVKTKWISCPHSPYVVSQLWKRVRKCEGVCDLTFQGVLISRDREDRCCFGAFRSTSGAAWNARAVAFKGADGKWPLKCDTCGEMLPSGLRGGHGDGIQRVFVRAGRCIW